ncbi:MAG: hypothetical protein MUF48_01015, partial [Pirellulaceae bacterium]|nr:hypothetical protein [Pirellulaceae bacterium]
DVQGRACQIVMVPTAPVPFGGALLLVPADCVQSAEMSVDGLMSIYVSMGVSAPQFMKLTPPPADPQATTLPEAAG